MVRDRWDIQLFAALVASILLHVTALVPGLIEMVSTPGPSAQLEAVLDPVLRARDRALGLESGDPSSLDWVAFEEYEEHLAQLAEANQADLARAAAQSHAATMEASLEVTPQRAQSEARRALHSPIEMPSVEHVSIPVQNQDEAPRPLLDRLVFAAIREVVREWSAAATGTDVPLPESIDVAKPVAEANPAESGQPSEKESDPTSRIEVRPEQWATGQPLAAKGIELFPKKPSFSLLDRLYRMPRDPVCLMRFDHRGKMIEAAILETSGDARIDANLISSLYEWRAKGAEIEALAEDETKAIEMKFVFD